MLHHCHKAKRGENRDNGNRDEKFCQGKALPGSFPVHVGTSANLRIHSSPQTALLFGNHGAYGEILRLGKVFL